MEFWGVEVKSGKTHEVDLSDGKVLHLSQACLGEIKNNKSSESICLHINVDDKKLVLGTLNYERLPQQLFDLVFDKNFTLSHNWKNGSVYFYGYKADQPTEQEDDSEEIDTDEEEEAMRLPLPAINGKQEAKKEEKSVVPVKKDAGKQKVKIVEPVKSDDSDSSDSSDDSGSDSSDSSDDSNSDEEDNSSGDDVDEDEETPKKISGKKRPNESSSKTPVTDKKAKMSTPQKTDGKKPGGHVATPHPSKKPGNTPATSKSNQKSPASAADGEHSCKACNRNFKSDGALQSHNQAKHK